MYSEIEGERIKSIVTSYNFRMRHQFKSTVCTPAK